MKKLLFLDIDFVLNSHRWDLQRSAANHPYIPYYSEIDPSCLILLEEILKLEPQVDVVISSSWRDDLSLQQFKDLFSQFNFPVHKIIAVTEPLIDKAKAIENYLKTNPCTSFVILDDDFLFPMDHPYFKNFYKVTKAGLRKEDIAPVLKILNT